ncbi:HK97 family phage prohead protease [Staphylococcus pseudintermedius]|nr:HK97 family phage prohead protease [Staphylococcus pseudintermedius]
MHFRATLPDTEEARSVYTAVKRGDLSGMSFRFHSIRR